MIVARIVEVLRGSTAPALVEVEGGERHVLKFAGAGSGPRGLLVEFIASRLARAFGAPVPDVAPLMLPKGFPWQVGTDEFDATVQRSFGWNLGVKYIAGARLATPAEILAADPGTLSLIVRADRLLHNVDRSAANPNVLIDDAGVLHAIDHDACLYFDRALSGRAPHVFSLPARHLLAGVAASPAAAPGDVDVAGIAAAAPDAWFDAAGLERGAVVKALQGYIAAFDA
ncbi:MAG: HipA family kinase [Hyphomonadaceae bacterium]|nr:HipA family kinase [Hyphomonadaceae bacterium]